MSAAILNSGHHRTHRVTLSALKPMVRDTVAEVAMRTGVTEPRRRARGGLTIATFHRVLPDDKRSVYPLPGLVVTPEELEWFLEFFTARYECLTVTDALDRWLSGDRCPKPLLAVTFDDGQRDNFVHARPVLARLRIPATFYVTVGLVDREEPIWHDLIGFPAAWLIGRPHGRRELLEALALTDPGLEDRELVQWIIRSSKELGAVSRAERASTLAAMAGGAHVPEWALLMSWSEVCALRDEGHEIGSHTMTHPLLPQLDEEAIADEVIGSRRALRERIDREIAAFCYPNGSFDDRSVAAVRRAGYRSAVTTGFGVNRRGGSLYTLSRCDINSSHSRDRRGRLSPARLSLRLSGLQPGLSQPQV